MSFVVGDKVVWTSQASSFTKTKHGEVVAVVPAKEHPVDYAPEGMYVKGPGMPRNHETYLVRVGKKIVLYWPRVSLLIPDLPLPKAAASKVTPPL